MIPGPLPSRLAPLRRPLSLLRAAPVLVAGLAVLCNGLAWMCGRALPHQGCEPLLLLLPLLAMPFLTLGDEPRWSRLSRSWLMVAMVLLAWTALVDWRHAQAGVAWPRLAVHALAVAAAGMVLATPLDVRRLLAWLGACGAVALLAQALPNLLTYVAHPYGLEAMASDEIGNRLFGNLNWTMNIAVPALLAWLVLAWPAGATAVTRRRDGALLALLALAAGAVVVVRGADGPLQMGWQGLAGAVLALAVLAGALHALARRTLTAQPAWAAPLLGVGLVALAALTLNSGRRSVALTLFAIPVLIVIGRARARWPRATPLTLAAALALGLALVGMVLANERPGRHHERLQIARAGVTSALQTPLGQGDCAALRLAERDPDLGRLLTQGRTINHLHDEWLECWLTAGLPGLALLGALTALLVAAVWRVAEPRLRLAVQVLAVGTGIAAATENTFAGVLSCAWLGAACAVMLRASDSGRSPPADGRSDALLRGALLHVALYCAWLAIPAFRGMTLGKHDEAERILATIPALSDAYAVTTLGQQVVLAVREDAQLSAEADAAIARALGGVPWGEAVYYLRFGRASARDKDGIALACLAVYPFSDFSYHHLLGRPPLAAAPELIARRLALLRGEAGAQAPELADVQGPATFDEAATIACAIRGVMAQGKGWQVVVPALVRIAGRYQDSHITRLAIDLLLSAPDVTVAELATALPASRFVALRAEELVECVHTAQPDAAHARRLLPFLAGLYQDAWRSSERGPLPPGTAAATAQVIVLLQELRRSAGSQPLPLGM